jgi:hypothetical protein
MKRNVPIAETENINQANALHELYCQTRSEGFGDEVQVSSRPYIFIYIYIIANKNI